MEKASFLWTASKARLQQFRVSYGMHLNWLFIPGGPGLGSESLYPLLRLLELPGSVWRLDLPGDGSNLIDNDSQAIRFWKEAVIEAVCAFANVILVGHSTGGMFALSIPELEQKLKGLVLLDSAPDMDWQIEFSQKVQQLGIQMATEAESAYLKNPNNHTLKNSVIAGARFMFTQRGLKKGIKTFENLPYNDWAFQWGKKYFDPTYSAKWIPQKMPVLILAGSEDIATPLKWFAMRKKYHRNNILMKDIKNAGHFPWIENPEEVVAAFKEYCTKF